MVRIHVVSEENEANGMFVAARLLCGDGDRLATARAFRALPLDGVGEVWVHGLWKPVLWAACLRALRAGVPLVRMTHGALSPVALRRRGRWRKRLAAPIERRLFARCARVAVTGEWEKAWFARFAGPRAAASVRFESCDLASRFALPTERTPPPPPVHRPLRILYLGRRHPLKGLDDLRAAVARLGGRATLTVADAAFGEEKTRLLDACDVLALPSSSENFGLVVAEALARNRRALVTDAVPAWPAGFGGRLVSVGGWLSLSRRGRREALAAALGAFIEPSVP
jgi:glycosyltransferase involved in cell wall biosynthesis